MSNCTRNNKRHGAPSEVHKAARLDVRLVNRSTPGFRSTGAYTMLFDCSPELCSCPGFWDGGDESLTLGDMVSARSHGLFAASRAVGGVVPYIDAVDGGVFVNLGPNAALDVIVSWEQDLVLEVMDEVLAVPASGCVLAVGRPGMAEFVLLGHEATWALAQALLIQAEYRPVVKMLVGVMNVEVLGQPRWK
jgi:hypothetical protein